MTVDELGAHLAGQGLGTLATDLFTGQLPDTPDAALAVLEYPGEPAAYTHDRSTVAYSKPRIQITVRDAVWATGRARIDTAYRVIERIVNQTVGAGYYLRVQPLQTPFPLGKDDSNRFLFAFNCQVLKEGL